jgi:hypothetical protein
MQQKIKLSPGTYSGKDQLKSDKANKFIGRGSFRSSTHKYMLDWGDLANCGVYKKDDVVFVSAEGNRSGRLAPDFEEVSKAIRVGVTFITDDKQNRSRAYNIGEREIEAYLVSFGYEEVEPGMWRETA